MPLTDMGDGTYRGQAHAHMHATYTCAYTHAYAHTWIWTWTWTWTWVCHSEARLTRQVMPRQSLARAPGGANPEPNPHQVVPTCTGPHSLSITIEHSHVAGSPFKVHVGGGVAVGSASRARAPFLLEASAPSGQQVEPPPAGPLPLPVP